MNIFQKSMNKILVARVAKHIGKEEFLSQLYTAWYPLIGKNADIDQEVQKAWERIKRSGMKGAFDAVGVTETDIRQTLESIIKDKPEQVTATTNKIGRNDPCPCGSGKKYKRCCGNL